MSVEQPTTGYGIDTPHSPPTEYYSQPEKEEEEEPDVEYESDDEEEKRKIAWQEETTNYLRDKQLLESAALAVVNVGMQEANKDPDPNHVCMCDQKCGGRWCVCKKSDCKKHKLHTISAPAYEDGVEGRALEVLCEITFVGMLGRPVRRLKKNKPKDEKALIEKILYNAAVTLWRRNGFPPTHTLKLISGSASMLEHNIRRLVDSSEEAIKQDNTPQPCECNITPCAHAKGVDFFPTLWPGHFHSARDCQRSETTTTTTTTSSSSSSSAVADDE